MSLNTNMMPKYAHGGIGDLLQFLESAITEKVIDLYSHSTTAPDIFTPFNVIINRFETYKNLEEIQQMYCPGELLERKFFPKFEVPRCPLKKQKGKTIGIHIEGSRFSNDFWGPRGFPTKNMSSEFIVKLANELQTEFPKATLYFFCAPERQYEIGYLLAPIVKGDYYMIAFKNIWDTLSCVPHCNHVIGMDSCIKSLSAILSIPTTLLVGRYDDPFRDANFITPYVNEGIMSVIPFVRIDEVDTKEVIKKVIL